MLPERKLIGIRIRTDGRHQYHAMDTPVSAELSEPSLAVGLMFWANLFALSVIAALF